MRFGPNGRTVRGIINRLAEKWYNFVEKSLTLSIRPIGPAMKPDQREFATPDLKCGITNADEKNADHNCQKQMFGRGHSSQ